MCWRGHGARFCSRPLRTTPPRVRACPSREPGTARAGWTSEAVPPGSGASCASICPLTRCASRSAKTDSLRVGASGHARTLEEARRLAIRGPAWEELAARLPRPRGPRPVQELQDQERGRELGQGVRRRGAAQPASRVPARIRCPRGPAGHHARRRAHSRLAGDRRTSRLHRRTRPQQLGHVPLDRLTPHHRQPDRATS